MIRRLVLVIVLTTGCSSDGTAPVSVSWSFDVQPILTTRCATSGCHVAPAPQLGLDLSPDVAYINLVGIAAVELPSMLRVSPGEPELSYMYHKLAGTHLDVGGQGTRMPSEGPVLDAVELSIVRDWIAAGAPDN